MNAFDTYALLPASLLNLYHRRGIPGFSTFAIAFALTGMLVLNVWSILCLIDLLVRVNVIRPIVSSPGYYVLMVIGAFFAEVAIVRLVQEKTVRSLPFAALVRSAPPQIWIWYTAISVVVFVGSGVALSLSGGVNR
jgi:hypothetical protein